MEKLDKYRGNLPREEFLELLLNQRSDQKSSEEGSSDSTDKAEESKASDNNKSESVPSNEEALNTMKEILSKVELIDTLNERMTELEKRQSHLKTTLTGDSDSLDEESAGPEADPEPDEERDSKDRIVTDSGEQVKTFKFSGEEDEEPDENLLDIDIDLMEDEIEDANEDSTVQYQFVFGCVNCNNTIEGDDTICPFCGEQLEELPSGEDWLQQQGESSEDYIFEDDWDENDEDSYDDFYDDEDYNPAGNHYVDNYPTDYPYGVSNEPGYTSFEPANLTSPPCAICGGETQYIDRYGRWYCYRCSAYVPSSNLNAGTGRESVQSDRSSILENILSRRHSESSSSISSDEKPLKQYGPYTPPEAITKISLVDTEKPEKNKKRFNKR